MKYDEKGHIITNINGVEIRFDVKDLCAILEIPNDGLCIFESKHWPKVKGFNPIEVDQRLCVYSKAIMKHRLLAHNLSVLCRILQHMISCIFIRKGGHRDDVSYFKGFLVDSILTEQKINMGYIIFLHMRACLESTTSLLSYGMFITKIMKFFNVNLSRESDARKLKKFATYNIASLHQMNFERNKNGKWRRKSAMEITAEQVVEEEDGDSLNGKARGDQEDILGRFQKEIAP